MLTEQQFQDLLLLSTHSGWKTVSDYIEKQILMCQTTLELHAFKDLSEVTNIQGKIMAYRTILEYPKTRIKEYRGGQVNAR